MPDASRSLVEVKDVSLQFGDVWALRDVSLNLNPGDTRIILGAAGSGKTTLLKALIGLIKVDRGDIKLFDQDVTSMQEHDLFRLRSRAGFLFQEGGLFDSLSVGENVEYPLLNQQNGNGQVNSEASQSNVEDRVRQALRFVELEQTFDKFPSELSGGMRRRVGIARAIVTEPPLVLYDSPTAGLDPITANTIMALVAKERDVRNTGSFIVTHRYQDGELMANFRYNPEREELVPVSEEEQNDPNRTRTKFIVMKEGEIVFFGTRQELEQSGDEYVKRFIRHEG
ncbi:MAG: ATP-binding cassette domain-containing protein [Acidobacteriaceae bacterium]|nr:ATP-binding cassette domain-containing protein [Acidobacteriaceae bacterium]MBV9294367.1 ATP-binding cassette domain-containing protein [Acidobacteriaceae bacterium]MBV9767733.1 ATP-binding cassette domain-containing protein [Acidobacteriaceae bacterium]